MAMAPAPTDALSHWYNLIEDFQASSMEFYASVEVAIQKHQVPDCEISRVDWREGGVLSARREYLRVSRGRHSFDICAAPFGTGFFVSWWLSSTQSSLGPLALLLLIVGLVIAMSVAMGVFGFFWGLLFFLVGVPLLFWMFVNFMSQANEGWDDALVAMPFLGPVYERIFHPETYYKMDTALMFQEAIRHSVLEVVDGLTSAKGVRALTELERKPILRELRWR
jgi:hypothetical protein